MSFSGLNSVKKEKLFGSVPSCEIMVKPAPGITLSEPEDPKAPKVALFALPKAARATDIVVAAGVSSSNAD